MQFFNFDPAFPDDKTVFLKQEDLRKITAYYMILNSEFNYDPARQEKNRKITAFFVDEFYFP